MMRPGDLVATAVLGLSFWMAFAAAVIIALRACPAPGEELWAAPAPDMRPRKIGCPEQGYPKPRGLEIHLPDVGWVDMELTAPVELRDGAYVFRPVPPSPPGIYMVRCYIEVEPQGPPPAPTRKSSVPMTFYMPEPKLGLAAGLALLVALARNRITTENN